MNGIANFNRRHFLFQPVLYFCFFILPVSSFSQQNNPGNVKTSSEKIFHTLNTQSCTGSLGDAIVNFTFGSGTNPGPPLKDGTTTLQYLANTCPNDGYYTIANYTSGCFNSWHTITDHTGDANGYFMLVNASYQPSDFYVQKVDGLCSGTTYQFSAWILNIHNSLTGIAPNITFSIESTDGTVLQKYNSGDIAPATSPVWKQYGLFFTTPAGVNSVVIRMKNNAPGGIGNDLALDDIAFRPAGPLTSITASIPLDSINICSSTVTLSANIETCYLSNEYQWQVNLNNGGWKNIPGATAATYTVPVQTAGNYKYRLLVSQAGNINVSSCRVNSNIITVVVVPAAIVRNTSAEICSGKSYTLPSGKTVNTTGDYKDTVRYAFGCDSLITNLQLTVQPPAIANYTASICQGASYTLPSGVPVSVAGIYQDTLRYPSGCDSIIRITHLTVKPLIIDNTWINSCEGQLVTLPWGSVVSKAGIYSDTIKYTTGCDSLIRNVRVHFTVTAFENIERSICPGQTYTLPSGATVSHPGIYRDTLRTSIGCDSIITLLTLGLSSPPVIQISKSNDVTCSLGISKLNASGGAHYSWWPVETLDNAYVSNPVVSPAATTVYHVKVTTDLGCTGEDSIIVNVSADPSKYNIYVPNAFTPNNDGLNDCFGVKYLGQVKNLKFSIYDRWGNRVFFTTNSSQCWDGRYNGKELKSDVFVYQISATTLCGEIFRKGTVVLIR